METPKLVLPFEGWAYLDWITGIMRVNCSRQTYINLKSPISSSAIEKVEIDELQLLLLETVTHESTHYLQICTTPYLYTLARELFRVIWNYLIELDKHIEQFDDFPSSVPTEISNELELIRSRLDSPGPKDLTVRDIVESVAFLVQKRTHWKNLILADYQGMLAGEVKEYTYAFEIALDYLGPEAYVVFPMLSSLSLWTPTPVETFVALCEKYPDVKRTYKEKLNFLQLLQNVSPYINYPTLMYPISGEDIRHLPLYEVTVRRLRELYMQRKFDIFKYMAQPHNIGNDLANEVIPPILFMPAGDEISLMIPDHFWPEVPRINEMITGGRAEKGKVLVLLLEISMRLQG